MELQLLPNIAPKYSINKKRRTDYLHYTPTQTIPQTVNVASICSPAVSYKAEISDLESPKSYMVPPEVINWNTFILEKVVNLFRIKFIIVSYCELIY